MPFDAGKVEELRKGLGLSQGDAAQSAGIGGKQHWSNLINREGNFRLDTVEKIAAALGVSTCDLITDGKKKPAKK